MSGSTAYLTGSRNLSRTLARALMEMTSSKYQAVSATVKNGEVVYTNSNGSQNIRSGGTASWRNNNPGNMVAGAPGIQPIGMNGNSAIFADYSNGFNAIVSNLQTPNYYTKTVGGAIAVWAPKSGGNDPVAYAKKRACLDGNRCRDENEHAHARSNQLGRACHSATRRVDRRH